MTDIVQQVLENLKRLPGEHPALKGNKLRKRAVQVLKRKPLPSRVEAYPTTFDASLALDVRNPVRNTELFDRVAEAIELFPEAYDQSNWGKATDESPCGTAFCIAGHAGHEVGWRQARRYAGSSDWAVLDSPNDVIRNQTVSELGRLELGLTNLEADVLFGATWQPEEGITVSEALRAIGRGANIVEVSRYKESMTAQALRDEYAEENRVIRTSSEVNA